MTTRPDQVLTFELGRDAYALPIANVQEVLEYTDITHVPKSPAFMKGVINVRGTVVPVVDLRTEFGMAPSEPTIDTCIIIVELASEQGGMRVGALVDGVREVIEVQAEQFADPPELGNSIDNAFICAMLKMEAGFAILLDLDRAFSVDQLRDVARVNGVPRPEVEVAEAV